MKKLVKFFILTIFILGLQSCNTLKEGFRSQKKNSTDEFLVEKKSPLIMPPEFSELPMPEIKNSMDNPENDIKELLSIKDEQDFNGAQSGNENNFESSILEKIRNN